MIGVIARAEEHPWVREFFELFKTPWEFFRSGVEYEVVFCPANEVPASAARLILVYGASHQNFDAQWGDYATLTGDANFLEQTGERFPIYGNCLNFPAAAPGQLKTSDGGWAVVRKDSDGQRTVRVGYELFQEVRHLLTQGQPRANAAIPTLDLHIAQVREWMVQSGARFVEIPPVPAGYDLVACLTHDVDHPEIRRHQFDHTAFGFLQRALVGSVIQFFQGRLAFRGLLKNWWAALKLPFVYLGWADDFWRQMGRYLELEKGFGSTFFVVPVKHQPGRAVNRQHSARRATQYEAADIAGDLRKVVAAGGEIGLHGIDAWLDASSGRTEAARVADAAGQAGAGVRMHWLCFDENSPKVLEAAGFSYDSTVGYNECAGYRAGTLQVYQPAGVERLLELPLHIMDTALFYPGYMNLSPSAAAGVVSGFVQAARRFGGVLTVNWHDRSLAPERLWGEFYRGLLAQLRRENAWCPTAEQAVSWFRQRRALMIEAFPEAGLKVRVRIKSAAGQKNLPGVRVRFYNSPGSVGAGANPLEVELAGDFSEVGAIIGPA